MGPGCRLACRGVLSASPVMGIPVQGALSLLGTLPGLDKVPEPGASRSQFHDSEAVGTWASVFAGKLGEGGHC